MYNWAEWLDHVTDPSNCFTITDNGIGTVTIKKAGTVMTQGTPQDQAHFNNMERGILEAQVVGALVLNFARQLESRADIADSGLDALGSEIESANEQIEAVRESVDIQGMDLGSALALVLNYARQLEWRADVSDEAYAAFEGETNLNLQDVSHALSLILNHTRQVGWQVADLEKWAAAYEAGEVEFTSTTAFPYTLFSRPSKTIALAQKRPNSDYVVLTEIVSFTGNVGEVVISDKLDNGFKLSYTGSASNVKIKYTVIGGPYS